MEAAQLHAEDAPGDSFALPGGPMDGLEAEPIVIARRRRWAESARRTSGDGHVLRGSLWYLASVGVTAVGGFAFWWLAARLEPIDTVGQASALFSVVMFLNFLTSMGLSVAVARYASATPHAARALFGWALTYTTVTSIIGTIGFLIIGPYVLSDDLIGSLWSKGPVVAFMLMFVLVDGVGFTALLETRLVTLRHWGWLFGRVLLINLIRLPLLWVSGIADQPIGLLLLLAGINVVSGFVGCAIVQLRGRQGSAPMFPLPAEARPALRYASVNYLAGLASMAPQYTTPLIIAATVTTAQNAAFYLAWTITIVVFIIPQTIGQVVLSEGSRDRDHHASHTTIGMILAVGIMTLLAAGAFGFSRFSIVIFGPDYRLTGQLLPVLILAGVPWAVTSLCLARARVIGSSRLILIITISFAVGTLSLVAVMTAAAGTRGAARGWLWGNVLAAFIAATVTLAQSTGHELAAGDDEPRGSRGFVRRRTGSYDELVGRVSSNTATLVRSAFTSWDSRLSWSRSRPFTVLRSASPSEVASLATTSARPTALS